MKTTIKPNTNFSRVQFQIILFIWLLIFAIPLLAGDTSNGIAWSHITRIWIEYGFVFVVFLINHFLLFPQFLKGRRILYFVSVFCILVLLVLVSYFFGNTDAPPADAMQPMRPPGEGPLGPPPHGKGPREFIPPSGNLLIISILMIGFDAGLSFAGKWLQAEQNKIILEKENVENKMAFLQNQVSPHFFMNTLNNIHALVDIDTEEAKEAIIRLSNMMAYMLYESQTEKISIQKEINFIKSYVELMKLRFSEEVEIKLEIPEKLPEISVPPLLTISYIENAFKHGISYESPSFIHLAYTFTDKQLGFELKNSNHAKQNNSTNSGIGLQNAQKRLDLLFKNNYSLKMSSKTDKEFTIKLNIPL
ncbi:histidine kinase [uncultured Draconibacterium sp.]|uniref:sensor histidine kinase n=1 Tax=uncultured Draconibacterium sp. TaxID=1573823 RepID=UPI0025CBF48D|nr:histidine kinase [uncultured Draconibacterium sp.]